MIDKKRIKRFIEGAKEAFKEVDDPTFIFPMNILSAYELATSIEELLKKQEAQSVIVHEEPQNGNILWFADCPKCKHGIERDKHKRFCGFCGQAVKWE